MEVITWIGGAVLAISFGLMVVGWLFWAVRRIVCGKQHKCRRDDCPLRARGFCAWAVSSPVDIERLKKLISELEDGTAERRMGHEDGT